MSIGLIYELVGCFVERLKNLETMKTVLKIQRLHNIVIKYPRMSALLNSRHRGMKMERFCDISSLKSTLIFNYNTKQVLI